MISTTLLVTALGLLTGGVAAASAPVCVSSSEGYPVGQVDYLFNTFCNQLATNKFATEQQVYGTPLISFDYTSTGSAACDLNNCLASYQKLVSSCALPNSTIWGTGSLDAGCGVYNFTIWDKAAYPTALGSATTTIQGSTLTTAPIITSTSTSSCSTTSHTSSSYVPVSTSTTSTTSSTLQSSVYYSNGTSTSSASGYGAASGSGLVMSTSVTASQTVAVTPATTTKPAVASASLARSGAEVVRISGFSLVAAACVVMWWI